MIIKNTRVGKKYSKTDKTKNDLIYGLDHNFYKYRLSKFFQISSIESKFDTLEMLYREFIRLEQRENTHHKSVVLNNALNEYNKLIKEYKKVYERESKDDKSYGWKQKYNPKKLKVLHYQPVKSETKSLADENRSDLKQLTQLKKPKLSKTSKPLRINLPRENFNSLVKNVVDNLGHEDYKTTVNNRRHDLENAEKFSLEVITKKLVKMKHANCKTV